jgi:hypothetical protein
MVLPAYHPQDREASSIVEGEIPKSWSEASAIVYSLHLVHHRLMDHQSTRAFHTEFGNLAPLGDELALRTIALWGEEGGNTAKITLIGEAWFLY